MMTTLLQDRMRLITAFSALILIAVLLIDMILSIFFPILKEQLSSAWGVILFIVITCLYGIAQHFILKFVKNKTKDLRKRLPYMNTIQVSVTLVQYMSIGIFALIAGQIVLVSHYLVSELVAVSAVTYLLAVILLCLFTSQFITWYRTNRNRMILLYAFATALLVGSVSTAGIFRILDLAGTPPERGPQMEGYIFVDFLPVRDPFYPPIPINAMLHIEAMQHIFGFLVFILMWAGTAMLLRTHYSERFGNTKYWIIAGTILTSFILVSALPLFADILSIMNVPMKDNLTLFILQNFSIFWLPSKLIISVSGILLAIAFLGVARSISQKSSLTRDYLFIAALGTGTFIISIQSISGFYPPFGIIAMSSIGLSSYLVLVGLYSSAVSVAEDVNLRRSIKKSLQDHSRLLHSIGSAQMEQEIKNSVMQLAKQQSDQISNNSGIQPSLSDEEIKDYMNEVLEEIKSYNKPHEKGANSTKR